MFKRPLLFATLVAILILSACDSGLDETPSLEGISEVNPTATQEPVYPPPGEPTLLFSEVLTGVEGNNNHDFIELYNTGTEVPLDLKGWSLWFKLSDKEDESLVYRWSKSTLVPPQGHYLLVYEGQDVGFASECDHADTDDTPERRLAAPPDGQHRCG